MASLQGGARAGVPPETVCIDPEADGKCSDKMTAFDRIYEMDPERCPGVTDTPPAMMDGKCCYEVRYDRSTQVVGCNVSGRPLLIEGKPLQGASQQALGWRRADTQCLSSTA